MLLPERGGFKSDFYESGTVAPHVKWTLCSSQPGLARSRHGDMVKSPINSPAAPAEGRQIRAA